MKLLVEESLSANFGEVFEYRFNGGDGTLIETDKEEEPGQVVILKGISDFAEEIVVRARTTRKRG